MKKHPFTIISPSPWPMFTGMGAFSTTAGFVVYMHFYAYGIYMMIFGFIVLFVSMFNWWIDVTIEATYEGEHTKAVQLTYKTGFALFIVSELMLFVSFFWCDFHFAFNPNISLGVSWPPEKIATKLVHHSNLPGLMNAILICSSLTVSISHYGMNTNNKKVCAWFLFITILLGLFFTSIQFNEYVLAEIAFSDSIYGSLLYLLTGFHGVHVIIGNIFLITCFVRLLKNHFTKEHHMGFLLAVYYWHFVDMIWLFVYYIQYVSVSAATSQELLSWYLTVEALTRNF